MKGQNRKFGLITGIACLVICVYRMIFHHTHFVYFFIPGAFLILIAIIAPGLLNPLRITWEKIGNVLGAINSYVILTLVFFIIVTPIALIFRLLKKDLLSLDNKQQATWWQQAAINQVSSLKQQF